MGQRNQIFVIANINGRYHTLAVLHRQYLYGASVIQRCLQLLRIFQSKENEGDLRRELQRARSATWPQTPSTPYDRTREYVFPFIATCLVIGAGITGNRSGGARIHLLSIDTTFKQTDNNDGFSILDITDPAETRSAFFFLADFAWYCRDNSDEVDDGNDRHLWIYTSGMTLMGAKAYVKAYEGGDDPHETDIEDESGLDDVSQVERMPRVALGAVKDLWPNATWASMYDNVTSRPEDTTEQPMSLKGMAMKQLIDALRHAEDDSSWMNHAQEVPDFLSSLRAALQEDPSILRDCDKVRVLSCAFKDCEVINLGSFGGLILGPELVDLLTRVTQESASSATKLVLPDMEDLTPSILTEALHVSRINDLKLGETPNIELKDLLRIARASSIRSFTCPALYQRAFDPVELNKTIYAPRTPASDFPCGSDSGFPLCQVIYIRPNKTPSTIVLLTEGSSGAS